MALPPSEHAPRFSLMRHFSLASLAGVLVVLAIQIGLYRHLAAGELVAHGEATNAALTQMFANTVWERHQAFLSGTHSESPQALRSHPAQAVLREDVLRTMRGLSIVKVKLYDLRGVTVFSTDRQQIGEHRPDNGGFRAASAGARASQLIHRERIDTFEGTVSDRDLVSSYLPLRASAGPSGVVGVIEVYSDVTDLALTHARSIWQVVGALAAVLVALYVYLLGMVRRADGILSRQAAERARQDRQIHHQAFHDALTGLPNRSSFMAQLGALVQGGRRADAPGSALMFIDLDRFKQVNDRFGHAAGDALLQAAAQRMRAALREGDQLYRIGGDEFTAILATVSSPEEASAVAGRLVEAVGQPFSVLGQQVEVGASVGLALIPEDGGAVDQLLRSADAAMYRAKSAGRGTHVFHRTAPPVVASRQAHLADPQADAGAVAAV